MFSFSFPMDSRRSSNVSRGRTSLSSVLVCLLLCACSSEKLPPQPAASTLRDTGQGKVIGFETSDGAHAWLGMPFARPPVGELRWRAPQPAEAWTGKREAVEFGAPCPQLSPVEDGEVVGDEDCLTLNVYAPAWSPEDVPSGGERLPVMVWIHGGGNSLGDTQIYDGSLLALFGPVIVVTVQYRLGVLGWFAHPSLRRQQNLEDDSGNYGTLDVVRALAWVQENISEFGGDPDRVLVFGESAGGMNTLAMMLSPRAEGLFHRAISQSGVAETTPLAQAENDADDPALPGLPFSSGELLLWLLVQDGQAPDRASARQRRGEMSALEVAEYLRAKSPEELIAFYSSLSPGSPMYPTPQLIQDGHVLPRVSALEAFEKGRFNRVPAILGTNRDETKLFMLMGDPRVRRLLGIPLWRIDPDLYDASAQYTTEHWKWLGADEPARRMRRFQDGVWVYRFDWDEERRLLGYDLPGLLGAGHAMEIPFVFGWLTFGPITRLVFDPDAAATDRALSNAMMSYWTEFAYTGDPGRGRAGEGKIWPAWSEEEGAPKMLILDTTRDQGIRSSSDEVTFESLLLASRLDPRLSERRDWCEVMAFVTGQGPAFDAQAYVEATGDACSAYPLESYPWEP